MIKKKLIIGLTLLTFIVIAILFVTFFKPEKEYKYITGPTQGTVYNIKYEDWKFRNLQPKINKLLHRFDLSLSGYIPQSIVSRINRNEPDVKLDEFFITAFNKSKEINKLSDGAFDITVAPLVNAWGFGPQRTSDVDSAKIDSMLMFVGMEKVDIADDKIVKKDPRVQLDFNAIAQGYSVDVVCDFLKGKGIKNYMVEIGGELKAKGLNHKGQLWTVGIDKPVEGNSVPGQKLEAILQVNNKAISTSGNYRAFHEINGVKYAHTIDPKTGYPIQSRLLSASLMTNDCMTADGLATFFMVAGLEKSIEFLSKHKEIDGYLIYSDDQGKFRSFATEGFQKAHLSEIQQ